MANNPSAKRVTPETAYEVWQSSDRSWTYFVLKKYQSPEKEAQNPFARWFCMIQSPAAPNGEYGDVYVAIVKEGTRHIDNPLHRVVCVKGTSIQTLALIGLSNYSVTELVVRDERLSYYLKLSIAPNDFAKVKLMLEELAIAIVCIDASDFLDFCLTDVQSSG